MKNLRMHGSAPFVAAMIHGGPGAPGALAPVASDLARSCGCGILEPLQTARTIDGLIEELRTALETHVAPPLILIGHSWGAWLSLIFAARHPALVRKLILIASGPWEESYATGILETRLSRLGCVDRAEALTLLETLPFPDQPNQHGILKRLGELFAKADTFAPLTQPPKKKRVKKEANTDAGHVALPVRADLFRSIWGEASALRKSGALLAVARQVCCPVLAIHGDHDPHPAEGVEKPLLSALDDFRFILLEKCGHEPWNERHARERFYEILVWELSSAVPPK